MELSLLVVLILSALLSFSVAHQANERTLILNPISRLSTRSKRTLLLPNYGSIKITVGLSKGLIGNNPKGLSLSYEICSYYAGPTVIKDLMLNEIRQKIQKHDDKSIKSQELKDYQETKSNGFSNSSDLYFSKLSGTSFKHYHPFVSVPLHHYKSYTATRNGRNLESSSEGLNFVNENVSRSYFDLKRSPLKKALDYLMGSEVMCVMLKPICMSKEFLLPAGYSMIQDIVRITALSLAKDLTSEEGNSNFCETIARVYPECSVKG